MTNLFTKQEAAIYSFAMRYALPRDTSAADWVVSETLKHWDRFEQWDKEQKFYEIRQQIELTPKMLNREQWEKILAKECK
jgi:hypothetical protein